MADFLTYRFEDSPEFMNIFDEAPLWSARFGFLLLDNIELKPEMVVLDIGSGAGFPLTELAERLGNTSKVYGIDPWKNANERAKQKIEYFGLSNVEIIEQPAEDLPFDDNTFDLITGNLGINNFDNRDHVIKECCRVLKPDGRIAITTNTVGHWKEFYGVFEQTLIELEREDFIQKLRAEQEHRGTIETLSVWFKDNGLVSIKSIEDVFNMYFVDGTAFLNHHFVKCGWMESWFNIFPEECRTEIFKALEQNLNTYASQHNGLRLTVPMAYIEVEKLYNNVE